MEDQHAKTAGRKPFSGMKPKTRRRLITAAVIAVLAVAVIVIGLVGGSKETPQLDLSDTTAVARTDLQRTISATGVVESASSTTVYSTVAYPVMAVHVEVGDKVQAGDLLAELDDHTIRNQIASQQLTLDQSSQSSSHQVQTAQDNYDNYKSSLDQGLNTSLNSAKNQVDTAYNNYEKARTTYNRYRDGLDEGENTTLIQAEAAYDTAKENLLNAIDSYEPLEEEYEEAKDAYDEAEANWLEADETLTRLEEDLALAEEEIALLTAEREALTAVPEAERTEEQIARIGELDMALTELEQTCTDLPAQIEEQRAKEALMKTALEQAEAVLLQAEAKLDTAARTLATAERSFETQKASYNAAVTGVDNTLADYLTNVQTAWDTYQNALTALAAAEKSAKDQLGTYENSLTGAQIGADKSAAEESLRQLTETLEDTRITAPVSGTVTAVYAKVGGSGSGLLFVIEDVDDLVVRTSVKGYDMGTVQTGIPVRIRSDATGDAELEGRLTTIAPTANKNAMGQTDTTGEAIFAAEAAVTSRDTGLRIGMEAQLDYILAEEHGVLAVPYDAVYTDEAGRTCILIAEPADDADHYRICSVEVSTGMDDDLDMAVSGPEIREGLVVIHEPDSYLHLLDQTVLAGTGLTPDFIAAMMGG